MIWVSFFYCFIMNSDQNCALVRHNCLNSLAHDFQHSLSHCFGCFKILVIVFLHCVIGNFEWLWVVSHLSWIGWHTQDRFGCATPMIRWLMFALGLCCCLHLCCKTCPLRKGNHKRRWKRFMRRSIRRHSLMVERWVKIEDLEASSFGITVKSMGMSSDACHERYSYK